MLHIKNNFSLFKIKLIKKNNAKTIDLNEIILDISKIMIVALSFHTTLRN